jgi:hypothetical protein
MVRSIRLWLAKSLQKFTEVHASFHNHFAQEPRLIDRQA